MSTALIDAARYPFPDPTSRRWTRAQLEAAESAGLFEGRRYELVEGELIDRMGKNYRHTLCMVTLIGWLIRAFGPDRFNPETPIDVASADNPISRPEPDLIALNKSMHEVRRLRPCPNADDIALLIEISDSTVGFDLTTKAGLYARAGIPEYWVLDVIQRRLVVHREPADGRYATVAAYREGESVAPLAAPRTAFPVSDAFREE